MNSSNFFLLSVKYLKFVVTNRIDVCRNDIDCCLVWRRCVLEQVRPSQVAWLHHAAIHLDDFIIHWTLFWIKRLRLSETVGRVETATRHERYGPATRVLQVVQTAAWRLLEAVCLCQVRYLV